MFRTMLLLTIKANHLGYYIIFLLDFWSFVWVAFLVHGQQTRVLLRLL